MIREFRDFDLRGNVVDLAVGIVIGAAFTAIVNSLVTDLLTPIIGILFSADYSSLSVTLNGSTISYGNFLNALISFIFMAAALFCFVVLLKRRRQSPGPETPTTKNCTECASEIPVAARRCPRCAPSHSPERPGLIHRADFTGATCWVGFSRSRHVA
ncbi:MAG: large conductance mechanosensitive channel protein MscL [Candidatus Limnocylindria bacterium]